MSWTDKNITDPQGDWGQAAENNDIGFGQGADNLIGWGWAHIRSLGHAVTNLLGKLGITKGFTMFIPDWDSIPANSLFTANEINIALLDTITFPDLTGATITTQLGIGAFTIVGNTLECTTAGTSAYVKLSNGIELLYSEKQSFAVRSTNGVEGTLSALITWNVGVNTTYVIDGDNPQTALLNWNSYINYLPWSNSFHQTYSNWAKLNSGRILNDRTILAPDGTITASTLEFRAATLDGISQVLNGAFTTTRIYSIWAKSNNVIGQKFRLRCDGVNAPQTSNDFTTTATWQKFEFEVTGNGTAPFSIYIHNGTALDIGKVDIWHAGLEDVIEPSEFIETQAEPLIRTIVPEDVNNLGTDILGNAINRPLLTDGLNFSDNNAYLDTIILNRTGSGTDGIWFQKKTGVIIQDISGDDIMTMQINASGLLEVLFNAVTLVSNQLIFEDKWYFVKFLQDGAGTGEIYVGTETVAPTLNATGAVGLPIAATTKMKFGEI